MIHPRRGFTFVEILLVMVVMAILFGLAYPRLTVLRAGSSVRSTKQRVAATIAAARQSAIARGVPVRFGVKGNTIYSIASPYAATDTVHRGVDVQAAYGATLGGGDFVVEYDPRGLAMGFVGPQNIVVAYGSKQDTLCVRARGLVQMRNC